ncbi:hypothetical protein CXG81DRAFT_18351 [Caulochytrium protostelioides]|uniref:WD repeat-containing protein JIP5 n=1 Tax=Caulochytrium protostelioides TaxID=1555241 RepID=A0A4P9XA04_9FUNG|nr:hypothetical protein CXG81DRAFT_18351 [Caulochytrium protostelioides]|eukprot:RKP01920.1 hypothetical protein CXG81DRAFT_18351 [Caulochytrium protostelioides]
MTADGTAGVLKPLSFDVGDDVGSFCLTDRVERFVVGGNTGRIRLYAPPLWDSATRAMVPGSAGAAAATSDADDADDADDDDTSHADGSVVGDTHGINGKAYNVAALLTRQAPFAIDPLMDVKAHKMNVRSVDVLNAASRAVSGSADQSFALIDLANAKVVSRRANAHDDAVNIVKYIDESLVLTADDAGWVKLWDLRKKACVRRWQEHEEYITDMALVSDSTWMVTGGDCYLAIYDIRTTTPIDVSDQQGAELNCALMHRDNKHALVGNDEGSLLMFRTDGWGNPVSALTNISSGLDSLTALEDGTIITGGTDGKLHAVSIHPNQVIHMIGCEADGLPILSVQASPASDWIASSTNASVISIWDPASNHKKDQAAMRRLNGESVPDDEDAEKDSDDDDRDSDDSDGNGKDSDRDSWDSDADLDAAAAHVDAHADAATDAESDSDAAPPATGSDESDDEDVDRPPHAEDDGQNDDEDDEHDVAAGPDDALVPLELSDSDADGDAPSGDVPPAAPSDSDDDADSAGHADDDNAVKRDQDSDSDSDAPTPQARPTKRAPPSKKPPVNPNSKKAKLAAKKANKPKSMFSAMD